MFHLYQKDTKRTPKLKKKQVQNFIDDGSGTSKESIAKELRMF